MCLGCIISKHHVHAWSIAQMMCVSPAVPACLLAHPYTVLSLCCCCAMRSLVHRPPCPCHKGKQENQSMGRLQHTRLRGLSGLCAELTALQGMHAACVLHGVDGMDRCMEHGNFTWVNLVCHGSRQVWHVYMVHTAHGAHCTPCMCTRYACHACLPA